MKITTLVLALCFALATSHVTLAYADSVYQVHPLVTEGKKGKEVKSDLIFGETSVKVVSKKPGVLSKEFIYSDISAADYSYSKKPLLSTGGAIGTAILIGVFVIPLLFMKKKQHWITIKGKEDFIVMRLDKSNFRQIKSELEVRKIPVNTIDEESKNPGK